MAVDRIESISSEFLGVIASVGTSTSTWGNNMEPMQKHKDISSKQSEGKGGLLQEKSKEVWNVSRVDISEKWKPLMASHKMVLG